ncbi:hypothetical protein DSECCO2_447570 [anaerobic digester metagenome]
MVPASFSVAFIPTDVSLIELTVGPERKMGGVPSMVEKETFFTAELWEPSTSVSQRYRS